MITIRDADAERDAAPCAAIYAPYVTGTAISFEEEPPPAEEFVARIRSAHLWLIAEAHGAVIGYAYGSQHRQRAAYRWAADVAVYIDVEQQRKGVGRALYAALTQRLRAEGFRTLCAGVVQPNAGSNALHEASGFEVVGTYRRVGWKMNAWHDVRWYQLDLRPGDDTPPAKT